MRDREVKEQEDKTMKHIFVSFFSLLSFFPLQHFPAFLFIISMILYCVIPPAPFLSFLLFYFISDENRQTNANKLISHIIWMNELEYWRETHKSDGINKNVHANW